MKKLTLATRASELALWQANFVKQALLQVDPDQVIDLLPVTTSGDRIQDKALCDIGGKGLFIKELEAVLLQGAADLAVHSMKDVPNDLASGLTIGAILERADPRDAFLSMHYKHFEDLPQGARVGTSSVRRRAQLLHLREDLEMVLLRGNIDTRLKKLESGEYDAIILAAAGLQRLGLEGRICQYFNFDRLLPSVAQGAIGIECAEKHAPLLELLAKINHIPTQQCVTQERAFTNHLKGDCASPIGIHAQFQEDEIFLQGLVASHDGKTILRSELRGATTQDLGMQLAEELLEKGAGEVLGMEIR